MRRVAIAFFYDVDGIVDEYFYVLLREMDRFCDRIVVVVNGEIRDEYARQVRETKFDLIMRENVGFDVWAYKEGLDFLGRQALGTYDELILMNHTFFGPIFPFEEMFGAMNARACDFWGITSHKGILSSSFGQLPPHLNSHFIAIRPRLLRSLDFRAYWADMPPIRSYTESILLHEAKFTGFFEKLGFTWSVYVDPDAYASDYPLFEQLDDVLTARCPIVKRRSLFVDPVMADQMAIDTPLALELIETRSDYDLRLIWANLIRTTPLRTLYTNTALLRIFADEAPVKRSAYAHLKICVCIHVYYPDLLAELVAYCRAIPVPYDVVATTDTRAKKEFIEQILSAEPGIRSIIVDVVAENVGADVAPLLITSAPRLLAGNYDLVCRLHTKKSPKDPARRAKYFKAYLLENLLGSEALVAGIFDTFAAGPNVGLMMPPTIHVSFPVMGNGWFNNQTVAQSVADKIGARVIFDEDTPIAPYGSMFWFKPKAMEKLLAYPWCWQDFHRESAYEDGDLPHAIERVYAYVAQSAGFLTIAVLGAAQAQRSLVRLEFKVQKYASLVPGGDFAYNCHELTRWKATEHRLSETRTEVVAEANSDKKDIDGDDSRVEAVCREIMRAFPRRTPFDGILHRARSRINVTLDSVNGHAVGDANGVIVWGQSEPLVVEGWTFPMGSKIPFAAIVVWLTDGTRGVSGRAKTVIRPDLERHFGSADLIKAGFRCALSIKLLPPGPYWLSIVGVDGRGRFRTAVHVVSIAVKEAKNKLNVIQGEIVDSYLRD